MARKRVDATSGTGGRSGADPPPRWMGMRAVAAAVPALARPVLGRYGLAESRLVTEWQAIVGREIAKLAMPAGLSPRRRERGGGTLQLRVAPGAALLVQHQAPQIIERVNTVLGHQAVARLSLVQGPLHRAARAEKPPPRPIDPAALDALEARLDKVADPALRDALARLGRAVLSDPTS